MQNIRITILIENTAYTAGLKTEHGLSLWIEYGNNKILFDTGQSESILYNSRALDVDLAQTDAIILSHGHYDHTGGLPCVINIASKAKIYLNPAATEPKFSQKASGAKSIGMPDSAKKAIQDHHIIWTATPAQLFSGMAVTGQVPRISKFEDVGGAFFLDENCRKPDELLDDQTLFIQSAHGLVVVLGCAHSGVVNTLDYLKRVSDQNYICAVIGGMHLLNASPFRIANTIETLKKYRVQRIVPLHCTGRKAVEALEAAVGDNCLCLGAGGRVCF